MSANDDEPAPSLARQLALVLGPTLAAALLSFALPEIALDGGFAELVVRVADSATWTQLPWVCAAMIILIVSRAGLRTRRRVVEAGAILALMLVCLAGNAVLNESVIKPQFAVPRPNVVKLAEAGALAPEYDLAADFYAETEDKGERRDFLRARLPELSEPALGERVREHWIHETGYSFPSGHATASMTFAALMVALGLAWLQGWRRWITVALSPVWALGVVYSRPLLGVHTPVDVSVGTVIGFAWGLLAFVVIRWLADKFGGPARATES